LSFLSFLSLEQINADNGGLGGTESMKTHIDSERKIVSIEYSNLMPPRIVAWRPVLVAFSCRSAQPRQG
jgi:hypothetical protein